MRRVRSVESFGSLCYMLEGLRAARRWRRRLRCFEQLYQLTPAAPECTEPTISKDGGTRG
jgi:hypothetical protein